MKVNNTSVFMGNDTLRTRHGEESDAAGTSNKKTIDGSALQAKFDPIAAKKEAAQKKAMKIMGDAFANECKIDDDLNARQERINALQHEKSIAAKEIRELENKRAALKDTYGIEEDSQEEADLKLLEKEMRSHMPCSDIQLSKEEREAVKKIKENGLSEYQQRSLSMLGHETPYFGIIEEADEEIAIENRIISATKLERLKSHTMVDAAKESETVMDAASEEIVGMLVDEAKNHIDEELEEREEKAEAEKEKQEELQEKIDAAKEEKKENEELTEEILESVQEASANASDLSAAQQEIKDMMNKMKLIEDDIKGAAVDKNM